MRDEIKSWQQLSVKLLQTTKKFELYVQRLRSPKGDYEDDFYFFDIVDWVNVIAITAQQEVVMVEQYRFGVHKASLEIPGGMLESKEDRPEAAASRELAEETGYTAEVFEPLGAVYPNPAMQTNTCFTYLARNAVLSKPQKLDDAEDIRVLLVPLADIPKLITEQRITHALMVAAFCRFFALESKGFSKAIF